MDKQRGKWKERRAREETEQTEKKREVEKGRIEKLDTEGKMKAEERNGQKRGKWGKGKG